MRFTCDARYRRFLEGAIAIALADAARDAVRRADDDPRIRALAWVPEKSLDPQAEGTITITIHAEPVATATAPTHPCGEPLLAFAPLTR